jgi:hypothetical protein
MTVYLPEITYGSSAEAAAVLAALPLFGSRRTFAAALAAHLLVNSLLDPRFGIACSRNLGPH